MNLRPSGYEPDELPDCSTPHRRSGMLQNGDFDFNAWGACSCVRQPYRQSFGTPIARWAFEHASARLTTLLALTLPIEPPVMEHVPITRD